MVRQITISTPGPGLLDVTPRVAEIVAAAGIHEGLCTVFLRHTSASLVIQENADPSARHDLESWMNRLVPDNNPLFTHDAEGPDDMPAHVKSALTSVSLSIPVIAGRLALGTWQGIFLWEHRRTPHARSIVVHVA